MKRPNILLIYTDQQRGDTIRHGGNEHIQTPNLDRLAADGVLFNRAFCNSPVCMPSRMSMLSGQYPSSIGVCCNGVEMPEDVPTVATILGSAGYRTANIGKLHFKNHSTRLHSDPHPSYGFDTLILSDEPGCYDDAYIKWVERMDPAQVENCRCDTPDAWIGDPVRIQPRKPHQPYVFKGPEHLTHTAFVASETERFLRAQDPRTPFFCIAGFYTPHSPINPPARFVDMYDPEKLPPPVMNEGENALGLSMSEWLQVKAYYYAQITHIDDQVGRIMKTLEETGLRDNTIVVFTSDHGEHLGDHGLTGKGAPGYDSCARVPLIVSCPGNTRGNVVSDTLLEAVDLAPTVLDFCGIQSPGFMQGRSLHPLLTGGEYEARDSVFVEMKIPMEWSWKTVRTVDWKYCVSDSGEELLFDLEKDPCELCNLAREPAAAAPVDDMRKLLLQRWFTVETQYPLRTGRY